MTGTAEAQLRLTIFAGVAQFERARCSTRIRESKAFLRSQGRFAGGAPPFGFRKVGERFERTRHDGPVSYIEPIAEVYSLAFDLLAKGYSSRLGRGEFVARGYNVSHVAVAKLFRRLRAECAT